MGIIMNEKRDRLTGLFDKDSCVRLVREYLSEEQGGGVAIVLDIDNFKKINSLFGVERGDQVLKETAEILKEFFQENDIISRIQGDQFVIFAKDCRHNTGLDIRLHELCTTLERELTEDENTCLVTASMGVAITEDVGTDFDRIYQAACEALDQAKKEGKGSVQFYSKR